jgi:hypothetical protein
MMIWTCLAVEKISELRIFFRSSKSIGVAMRTIECEGKKTMMIYRISNRALRFVSSLIAGMVIATTVLAAPFETLPSFDASAVLGPKAAGSNYKVTSPIRTDGLVRTYNLETPYGQFRVEGDSFFQMRLKELAAIEALSKVEDTKTFRDSFQKSLKAPVNFVGDAITKPVETVERTVSGVGRLFGRVASGVRNVGTSPDNMAQALLGVSSAKREIAIGLGVDPYTDFKPLAERLERAAQASAVGGLTVKGLFLLVPGGAGLAVSSASSASDVADLVRERTPSELRDINRSKLTRAVGGKRSIGLFLDNRNYTPADQTIIAEALFKLRQVRNVNAFLVRAAGIAERSQAVFMRVRAAMLARHHRDVEPFNEFVTIAEIPFCRSNDGKTIGVFPIDDLVWTERTAGLVSRVSGELDSAGQNNGVELFITGKATELSKKELQKFNWSITEQVTR